MIRMHRGRWLGLAPETEARLRELFGGQVCQKCGQPAARLLDGRFVCPRHVAPNDPPKGSRGPRTYRHPRNRS